MDAYTGEVTLYQWDENDPVLKTWMKAFPDTVKAKAEIPGTLLSHLRYPQDMFKVQRDLLGQYHVTDADSFFNGSDIWQVPVDPTSDTKQFQPPYYLTVRMPDPAVTSASFSLTTTFVPRGRDNLAAFMAVSADPGPDYGKLRILKVPGDSKTLGPNLVQSQFNSRQEVAQQITLLKSGGDSELEYGNLLTLPVGGGLLNVEPVYVRGRGAKYPTLQKVLAVYGNDNVAFENTLEEALRKVFAGAAPATTPTAPTSPVTPTTPNNPTTPTPGGTLTPELQKAIGDVLKAQTDADAAAKAGDWVALGQAQKAQSEAAKALAAAQQKTGVPATPTPTVSASASAGASTAPSPAPSGSP